MAFTPAPPPPPPQNQPYSNYGSPAPPVNEWSPWNVPGSQQQGPARNYVASPAMPQSMSTQGPPYDAQLRNYAGSPALPAPAFPSVGSLPSINPGDSLSAGMNNLTFSSTPQPHQQPHRTATQYSTYGPPPKSPSPPANPQGGAPSLTAQLPTVASLYAALSTADRPNSDPAVKVAWARDVLGLVERAQPPDRQPGPARLEDAELARLTTQHAIPMLMSFCANAQPPYPKHVAEALYWRACLSNSGEFPDLVPQNPRTAFRDFEAAARAGHFQAWFRLGRDYETVGDAVHARDCFERGVKYQVESCLYRMGMANLLGQLGLPARPEVAVPLLHRAATLATVTAPQPAYVFGLLLIDQFAQVSIPSHLFSSVLPPGTSPQTEARKHLERAAYLNFAPAQYKLGHAYEFALPPFPFDPLLSVQYYSLASQQGEAEADMSLSKWFLCGAEGCFDKDESLAYTFAEKAARRGLPSAEFAMGYYAEVGVGGPQDIDNARKWYQRVSNLPHVRYIVCLSVSQAAQNGNTDASERLRALSAPQAQSLSRTEHENITQSTLIRKRTQAKQDSDARPAELAQRPDMPRADAQQVVALARKNSKVSAPGQGRASTANPSHLGQGRRPSAIPEDVATPPNSGGGRRPSTQIDGPRKPSHQNSAPSGFAQQQQQQQQFANAPRYNLSDKPSPSSTPAPLPGRQQGAPPPASTPITHLASPPPAQPPTRPVTTAPAMKYETFAQMGIQGGKAQEKECIIM
jgi:TPR repeat protein